MIEFSSKKSGQSDFGRGRQEDNLTRIMPRRLTDKFCLALFLLVVVLFSIVTFRNINSAEFQKAFRPIDSSGHVCGDRGEKEDSQLYKYLYIDTPSKTSGPLDRRVCVKSCPTSQNDTLDCLPNSKIASCSELGTHSSKLIAGRICIPDDVEFYKDISRQLYGVDTSTVFEAVVGNYKLLLLSVAIGFALSFLYSKLMSVCAFFIVLLTFCAAFLASSLVGMRLFKKNVDLMMEAEGAEDGLKMRKAAASYKLFAFIVWGVTAALILLFIMMMGRIRAAIGVLQTAGKFMTENKSIILVPIFGGLKVVAVVAIWSISMIAYYSKAQHLPSDYSTLGKVDLGNYKIQFILLVFSLLWSVSLIFSGIKFVVATTVTLWYNQESSCCMSRVIKAVYWTLRYHLGTVCFGSLVLLIASSVKAVCQYILSRAPAPAGLQEVHWLLSKCILMLVSFVERLIRYFTSQVFTQVAISSQSFCSSAKSISKVTSISLLKFDFICEFMLLAGKLAVGALTTLICSKIIEHGILVEEAFNSTSIKTITLTIVFGLSWLVASLFTYLWSSACESVITLQALERAQANTPYDSKLGNTVGSSIDSISESRDLS